MKTKLSSFAQQTYEQLIENLASVNEACERIRQMHKDYPEKPVKPYLKSNPTSYDALIFAKELEKYEFLKKNYDTEKQTIQLFNTELDSALREFVKMNAGFYSIPEKYQAKVWNLAWEKGHSNGYNEVYNELTDLVNLFEED